MSRILILPAAIAALSLAACGDDNIERAVVGAAIGCAAGEVLVDGRCVEGAVVGAGVGVLTN